MASMEALQGSILPQNEGAVPEVDRAAAWAAGACLEQVAVQGGGVVQVVHQGEYVAWGPLAIGLEDQGPYEAERQEEPAGAGKGEWAG